MSNFESFECPVGMNHLIDLDSKFPKNAYGIFEPEGFFIWINEKEQQQIGKHLDVIAHEYTHYMHNLSTWHSIQDFISLFYVVFAGIQQITEQEDQIKLPLLQWSLEHNCPAIVKEYITNVQNRRLLISTSFGNDTDIHFVNEYLEGEIYEKNNKWYISTSESFGTEISRLSLMEGAAMAKKCQAAQNVDDLINKLRSPRLAYYYAAFLACKKANPRLDPLTTSSFLSDISLCTHDMSGVFQKGIKKLEGLPLTASIEDFEKELIVLYNDNCRNLMANRLMLLNNLLAELPEDHKNATNPSWVYEVLKNSISAVQMRQNYPLSLIKPNYKILFYSELVSKIGSPVIFTNDMRLTGLSETPLGVTQARNSVRALNYLCQWVTGLQERQLVCPYTGCPGCPEGRKGEHCGKDATIALKAPGTIPLCILFVSANQLRITKLLI